MNRIKRIIGMVFFAILQIVAHAQNAVVAEPSNDLMRSNGKIYLVMTIVVVLITGLLLYVLSIDRRISKLENK
jgi:hypothetical protein